MKNVIQKIKEVMYKAALTFTLMVLVILPFAMDPAQKFLGETDLESIRTENSVENMKLLLSADKMFVLLFMSLCIGASFIVFKINKLPPTAKRIIHVCLCYGISLAFILSLVEGKSQAFIIGFVLTAVFIVVYSLLMLISFLSRKLEKKFSFEE